LADKLATPGILNRQSDNADFIYTLSDLLGLRYDGYLDDESLVSKSFVEDSIVVGDPYGKSLRLLEGTKDFELKQKVGMHY
jgi:heptose-I-phosphate ethanolaminephosphotransferase